MIKIVLVFGMVVLGILFLFNQYTKRALRSRIGNPFIENCRNKILPNLSQSDPAEIGECYSLFKEYDKAIPYLTKYLTTYEPLKGKYWYYDNVVYDLCEAYYKTGRFDQARPYCQAAMGSLNAELAARIMAALDKKR